MIAFIKLGLCHRAQFGAFLVELSLLSRSALISSSRFSYFILFSNCK